MNEMRDVMKEENPEALFADGFDEAIIGICRKAGSEPVVTYSYDKCIQTLMNQKSGSSGSCMSHEEAIEWMEFNVVSAYMGIHTPVFIETPDLNGVA